jgi:hypothetical protein
MTQAMTREERETLRKIREHSQDVRYLGLESTASNAFIDAAPTALKDNKSTISLGFFCRLDDARVDALCDVIKSHPLLRLVELQQLDIPLAYAKKLAEAIKASDSMRSLNILSVTNAKSLQVLSGDLGLTRLTIYGDSLDAEKAYAIGEGLCENRTLVELGTGQISWDNAKLIHDAIAKNQNRNFCSIQLNSRPGANWDTPDFVKHNQLVLKELKGKLTARRALLPEDVHNILERLPVIIIELYGRGEAEAKKEWGHFLSESKRHHIAPTLPGGMKKFLRGIPEELREEFKVAETEQDIDAEQAAKTPLKEQRARARVRNDQTWRAGI